MTLVIFVFIVIYISLDVSRSPVFDFGDIHAITWFYAYVLW